MTNIKQYKVIAKAQTRDELVKEYENLKINGWEVVLLKWLGEYQIWLAQ